jgi:hypothetical protein
VQEPPERSGLLYQSYVVRPDCGVIRDIIRRVGEEQAPPTFDISQTHLWRSTSNWAPLQKPGGGVDLDFGITSICPCHSSRLIFRNR